ncbi:MAG: HD-GYP domain-containing protein [Saccharofermentanales bacterium]
MIFENINNFIKGIPGYAIAVFIAILIIMFIVIVFFIIKKNKKGIISRKKVKIDRYLAGVANMDNDECKYDKVLELVRKYIRGDGYFLYIHEKERNQYRLKRVLFENTQTGMNQGGVNVSYGRIMPYARESYAPSLVFSEAVIPKKISLLMEGRFPVVVIPVKDDSGFISISTRKKSHIKKRLYLEYIAANLENLFKVFADVNNKKTGLFEKETVDNDDTTEKDVLDFSLFVMGAKAGFFIKIENDYGELLATSGINLKTEEIMLNDSGFLSDIAELVNEKEYIIINKNTHGFYKIPNCLTAEKFTSFIVERTDSGIIAFCYTEEPDESYLKEYRRKAVDLLTIKMSEKSKTRQKKNTPEFYIRKMKNLASLIDKEETYSIGFSELLSQYAAVISRELGLDPEDIKDIKIAAYLSNIGVTVIPESILSKKGVFTAEEYEIMKVHSEAGALFVALLTGNNTIEQYIRYHHERPDGMGYPEGLKGGEIPQGARIIAVAQTFLGKIKGRNYRNPISFEKIIMMIEDESGVSLDAQIVDCLILWFRKKEKNPIYEQNALGPCWEMRCATEAICASCPVYKRTDRQCWTFESNNCLKHGNTCDTCHVYTEFINRHTILNMEYGENED